MSLGAMILQFLKQSAKQSASASAGSTVIAEETAAVVQHKNDLREAFKTSEWLSFMRNDAKNVEINVIDFIIEVIFC